MSGLLPEACYKCRRATGRIVQTPGGSMHAYGSCESDGEITEKVARIFGLDWPRRSVVTAPAEPPMNGVIRWEDPPLSRRRRLPLTLVAHAQIAAELRSRRGQWAVVSESGTNPTLTKRINQGLIPAYRPAGDFEAVSRANGAGVIVIYARYLGEGPP